MDNTDKKLLLLLEKNARISLKNLSEQLFLSPPAVAARIESLQRLGIIQGYVTKINKKAMGYNISAIINITIPPAKKEEFASYIKNINNVLECYHVSGPYSIVLKACFTNTDELNTFVASLQAFGNTLTQVIFSELID